MNETPVTPAPAARSGGGCFKGCAIGCLVMVVLLTLLAIGGLWFARHQYNAFITRMEREGYRKVEGQIIVVTNRITEPTIFIGQMVAIQKGSERGLAVVSQNAELDGEIVGNVHFVGQTLTVRPGAMLRRDLDVIAQTIRIEGEVRGKVTGMYQFLEQSAERAQ
jgi:hypothetical protein